MKKTLIIRYHRLGDALIILPLIYDLAIKYPEDIFTVLSNAKLRVLFDLMPSNVKFIPMVSKKRHAVFRALRYTIEKQLLLIKLGSMKFDNVALLQGESFERRLFKRLYNKNVNVVKIENPEFDSSKRLSLNCNDGLSILGLHKEKLALLGYDNIIAKFDASLLKNADISGLYQELAIDIQKKTIAIAPFSLVESKIYPLEKMEEVVSYFSKNTRGEFNVVILGGGNREKIIVDNWKIKYPSIINLIDRVSFSEEVSLIAQCDLVLTMDSANLHLASLLDTPVVSIWGTTVPKCGYYPEKENIGRAIVKNVDCQPCSLWGDKLCMLESRKYDCMDIAPEIVIKKIEDVIYGNE
jgi:ADP-heptose:LPS heptosyltransferase